MAKVNLEAKINVDQITKISDSIKRLYKEKQITKKAADELSKLIISGIKIDA